jgi:hypothetical protein
MGSNKEYCGRLVWVVPYKATRALILVPYIDRIGVPELLPNVTLPSWAKAESAISAIRVIAQRIFIIRWLAGYSG